MANFRVAFQLPEGLQDRVSQGEVELGEGIARRAGQGDLGHEASACTVGVLVAHLFEWDFVAGCEVVEPTADRRERVLIGEDLSGFLEGFVLVDGYQDRRRAAASGDGHVFSTIGDLGEQLGEVGAELPNRHDLRHTQSVPRGVHERADFSEARGAVRRRRVNGGRWPHVAVPADGGVSCRRRGIGCRGLLVHGESEQARDFYRHLIPEFESSPTDELHLVLLLKDIKKTLQARNS